MVRSLLPHTVAGILLVSAVLGASKPASEPRSSFETKCLQFDPTSYVSSASVNALEFVTAGTTLQFPDNDPSCARPNQTVSVDICRVALNISTSDKSGIIFESWLPESWTGRFLATGNGGIDGCIKYEDIDYGCQNGFSAVGSNNGHNGTGGLAFFHNDEVLEDYVWRSYVFLLRECLLLKTYILQSAHNHRGWEELDNGVLFFNGQQILLPWMLWRWKTGYQGRRNVSRRLRWHCCRSTSRQFQQHELLESFLL